MKRQKTDTLEANRQRHEKALTARQRFEKPID